MDPQDSFPEEFEGSEDEKLHLENELLKLKMQAELGGDFYTSPDSPPLPPEVEREFLQQILSFHEQEAKNPRIPLRQYLGHPEFPPAITLSEEELAAEWERLQALYDEKGISVDFLAEYPIALRYDFMAGEMLDKDVHPFPGWHFIYEDFYPNHDYDQRRLTEGFSGAFFKGEVNEYTFSNEMLNPDMQVISLDDLQALFDRFHDLFPAIKGGHFEIENVSAQTDEEIGDSELRLGFTEGTVTYQISLSDGSEKEIKGPFKLFMECRSDFWQVVHFYVHGFSWK